MKDSKQWHQTKKDSNKWHQRKKDSKKWHQTKKVSKNCHQTRFNQQQSEKTWILTHAMNYKMKDKIFVKIFKSCKLCSLWYSLEYSLREILSRIHERCLRIVHSEKSPSMKNCQKKMVLFQFIIKACNCQHLKCRGVTQKFKEDGIKKNRKNGYSCSQHSWAPCGTMWGGGGLGEFQG